MLSSVRTNKEESSTESSIEKERTWSLISGGMRSCVITQEKLAIRWVTLRPLCSLAFIACMKV